MDRQTVPPVINPGVDVAELLRHRMGDTGDLHETLGGFRIHVHHTRAFPWAEVFQALLYRGFKVSVTTRKADLIVEAAV